VPGHMSTRSDTSHLTASVQQLRRDWAASRQVVYEEDRRVILAS
jgi:hypothetical protein